MNEQEVTREAENGQDPARLERDIDRTRARLGRTVDALERRLSPGELLDQALGLAREHGGQFATNLGRSVVNNPVPVILTGVGLAWMMASSNEPRASSGHEDWSPADDGDVKSRLKAGMSSAKSAVGSATDRASRVTDSVAHSIADFGHSAGDVGESLRRQGEHVRQGFDQLMHQQPLVVGAIGLAIGAALGAALPGTESEDELLGRASDSTKDTVRERAAEAYDKAKDAAADVVATARTQD